MQRLRFNQEKYDQMKADLIYGIHHKYTQLTASKEVDDEKVSQYINLRAARSRLACQVTLDFWKAYKRLESNISTFNKLPANFEIENDTVVTQKINSTALFHADELKEAISPGFKKNLDTRIADLEKSMGYYPGINWKLMGYSTGAGVLAGCAAKVGVMKLVSTILVVGAFGFVMATIFYGCYKALSRDPLYVEINAKLKESLSEEAKCQKEVVESLIKDETLRYIQNADPVPYLKSLYKWDIDYKKYYKGYVDKMQIEMSECQQIN